MANIIRSDPSALFPELGLRSDPFQTMRQMLQWDPFSDLLGDLPIDRGVQVFNPSFDVRETNEAFILQADVPGVTEKDIDISLTDNRLAISGFRQSEEEVKGDTQYRKERTYGSFSRTFSLPRHVDENGVSAELKSGVLTIRLPKTGEAMAKHIPIQAQKEVNQVQSGQEGQAAQPEQQANPLPTQPGVK